MSPRTPEENEKIRQNRKTGIIKTALKLFAEQGYHKTTISEIAKETGMSKGLLYNYFKNKEDLLKAVVIHNYQEASDQLFQLFQNKMKELSHDELLRVIIEAFFVMMKEYEPMWKLSISLSMQIGDMPEIKNLMFKIFNDSFERISLLLPENKDTASQARIIAATMDGIALHYYLLGDAYDLESVKNTLINNLKQLK